MVNRNKKIIMILSTVFTVVLALSFTYAFFYYGKEGSTITLKGGTISINFEEDVNYLTLHDTYPKSDSVGMISTNYYDFTVSGSNGKHDDILYEIQIEQLEDNTLAEEYVNVYLTDQEDFEFGNKVNNLLDLPISKYNGNRVVYSDYIYSENQVEDYRLRVWVDEKYDKNVQEKFEFKVVLYAVNDKFSSLYKTLEETLNPFLLTPDGDDNYDSRIVAASKNDENLKNYIWYSGKMWRVVSLNNNGTVKLVTDESITSLAWGADNIYYGIDEVNNEVTKSWMFQWLNEDFLDTLYNYNYLLDSNYLWNATLTSSTAKPAKKTMAPGYVGLLNAYEYTSTKGANGYLNQGYAWWLLNPYNDRYIRYKNTAGNLATNTSVTIYGVRPSIVLRPNVSINCVDCDGSEKKPYILAGDISDIYYHDKLNTRLSGEYVKYNGDLFRIVAVENDLIKITSANYLTQNNSILQKRFASSTKFGSIENTIGDKYWDSYLNETWYNSIDSNYKKMIITGNWFISNVESNTNYKNVICEDVDTLEKVSMCERNKNVVKLKIGLGRYGEMFTAQLLNSTKHELWILNSYNDEYSRYLGVGGGSGAQTKPDDVSEFAARPSLYLSSDVYITSGNGTKESPFEISI